MQRNRLKLILIIVAVVIGYFILAFYSIHTSIERELDAKITLQKKNEPALLAQAKPAFESEITRIVPGSMRQEIANYGNTFKVSYAQNLTQNHEFDGYSFSRVYRVRNLSIEEIENQVQAYAEQNGYSFNENPLYVSSSPRDFRTSILFIPFTERGYMDIQVELYRKY